MSAMNLLKSPWLFGSGKDFSQPIQTIDQYGSILMMLVVLGMCIHAIVKRSNEVCNPAPPAVNPCAMGGWTLPPDVVAFFIACYLYLVFANFNVNCLIGGSKKKCELLSYVVAVFHLLSIILFVIWFGDKTIFECVTDPCKSSVYKTVQEYLDDGKTLSSANELKTLIECET